MKTLKKIVILLLLGILSAVGLAEISPSPSQLPEATTANLAQITPAEITGPMALRSLTGDAWPRARIIEAKTAVRPDLRSVSEQYLSAGKIASVGETCTILGWAVKNADGTPMVPVQFDDRNHTLGYVPAERLKLEPIAQEDSLQSMLLKISYIDKEDSSWSWGDYFIKIPLPKFKLSVPDSSVLFGPARLEFTANGTIETQQYIDFYQVPYSILINGQAVLKVDPIQVIRTETIATTVTETPNTTKGVSNK